ncbi:MAG: hypothetical protein RPU42_14555 [Candidatus Sedimenticola sp. (ex Thyasira tokunagai)]
MKMRKLLFISMFLGSVFMSPVVMAVDGYKGLKFGMTKEQVLESKLCTFEEQSTGQDGVVFYGCSDFIFGGEAVEAGAFFIGGKFLRFAIIPSLDVAVGLTQGLTDKYGPVSSASTKQEFNAVDTLPNRSAFLAFDKDTVYLKLSSDENYVQSALLLYTSPRFDALLFKGQKKAVSDDL